MSTLRKQPYKGTRDFYPDDMRLRRYIFSRWQDVVESYGYEAYDGPMLELTELYQAKSGDEIVDEQSYSFTDRGDRDVTIRPEMTPTLARMVAAREQELNYPLRWYSIPNLWRYERPQRGRLREHWQLNVDIFGVDDIRAEYELILIANELMQAFGASSDMYKIRINNRRLTNLLLGKYLGLNVDQSHRIMKLLDRKAKMDADAFRTQLEDILKDKADDFEQLLEADSLAALPEELRKDASIQSIAKLFKLLNKSGIENAVFDLTLMRGFDYYTGIVFEIFDTHPDNNRSIFGGGRYDHLLNIFDVSDVPGVGFGMGDAPLEMFLRSHELLPDFSSMTDAMIITIGDVDEYAFDFAQGLRGEGLNVAVDFSDRKVGQKITAAADRSIPYAIFLGEDEIETQKYQLKNLRKEEQFELSTDEIVEKIKSNLR